MIAGIAGVLVASGVALVVWASRIPAALEPDREAPTAVLFDNVRVVSMMPGAPAAEQARAVLVVGSRIEAVGPAESIKPPEGTRTIDAAGRTLMPGLIDAHVHVWDEAELAGYLAHGVTGIRNMSGMPFHVPLERRIRERSILGPDFMTTGPILNSHGPNEQPIHQLVDTADDAREAVRRQQAAGFRAVKIYSNLTRSAFEAILDEAARLGMTVTGHTPEGVREAGIPFERPFDIGFEESLGRGLVTIEHVESIVWHGLRDRLDEEAMHALAEKIAASGDAVTPTLLAHANLVRVAASDGAYLSRPGTETINPLLRLLEGGHYEYWSHADPDEREAPRAEFYLEATRLLHEAGVPLVAGSDAGIFTNIPGSAMARELELLVKAGLPPHEALAAATRVGAEIIGFDNVGVIAPGWRANLLLLPADPLEDVGAVEDPEGVMVGGHWLDQDALADLREGARDTSLLRTAWRAISMKMAL